METVMKKLIFILLASLTFLLSCDPHNTENSINIRLDKDTVNKILSTTSARFADPIEGYPVCLYAVLKGSNKTTYETTRYFDLEQDYLNTLSNEGITISFSGVSYRENYDLLVYVVNNGNSEYFGKRENLELNKYAPTYVDITLNYITSNSQTADLSILPMTTPVSSGSYNLIEHVQDYWNPTDIQYGTFNNKVELEIELSNVDNYYTYDVYVIHRGKETPLTLSSHDPIDKLNLYYYTITSPGEYVIACRITENSTQHFWTTYKFIELKSNAINTNYVFYDNNNALNVWFNDNLNEPNNNASAIFTNAASLSNFDYCFDFDNNIYISTGDLVFRNNETNSLINAQGRTIEYINYDSGDNIIFAHSSDGRIGYKFLDEYSDFFSWMTPHTSYDTLLYVMANNGKLYYFYSVDDDTFTYNNIIIKEYDFYIQTKLGAGSSISINTSDLPNKTYFVFSTAKTHNTSDGNSNKSIKISDAIVLNNTIYFLANMEELVGPWPFWDTPTHYYTYCNDGILGSINLLTNQINITGINNSDIQKIQITSSEYVNQYYYKQISPGYVTSKTDFYFVSPQKFIAIKPKQLVISDDGIFVWWDDTLKQNYYNELNRVVTVNLDNFSVLNVQVLSNICWKIKEPRNSWLGGCGELIYTPDN